VKSDIAKMMKTAAATVAARVHATPAEILEVMQTEWTKAGKAQRRHIEAYLRRETAITVH
jgi:hypothetical protein